MPAAEIRLATTVRKFYECCLVVSLTLLQSHLTSEKKESQ